VSSEKSGNSNNMVVVPDNAELAFFTAEFNYMWQGLFKSRKPYRSP